MRSPSVGWLVAQLDLFGKGAVFGICDHRSIRQREGSMLSVIDSVDKRVQPVTRHIGSGVQKAIEAPQPERPLLPTSSERSMILRLNTTWTRTPT